MSRVWELALITAAVGLVGALYLERPAFALDDYRYLWLVERVDEGAPGALQQALVVENRWDESWWIPDGSFVRFFRPLVAATYAIDAAVWGRRPLGFTLTNLLLFGGLTVLVWWLLRLVVGGRFGPLLGALAFGTAACHAELLHYVAGRTDTLAGLAVVGGLVLHLRHGERTPLAGALGLGVVAFAGLLAKEWVVLLPFLMLARDGPRAALTRHRNAYLSLAAALGLYGLLRAVALGEAGAGTQPFPYFQLPGRDGFWEHTLALVLQYTSGLVAGTWIAPFLSGPQALLQRVSPFELGASGLGLLSLGVWAARRREGRWLLAVLVIGLVPLLPLYASGRYLLLPSVAYAGLLGLAARTWTEAARGGRRIAVGLLLAAAVIAPAARHFEALDRMHPRDEPAGLIMAPQLVRMFRESDVPLERDRPVYVLDFPGRWIEVQFLPFVLAVELGRPLPPIVVLTQAPVPAGPPTRAIAVSDRGIELDRSGARLQIGDPDFALEPRDLLPGDSIRERDYMVAVVDARAGRATRVRVELDRPLGDVALARGVTDSDGRWRIVRVSP